MPGAGRVTLVVIIGRGLMIISSTIVFVSMLPVVVLVKRLRVDVWFIYWCAALGCARSVAAAQWHQECHIPGEEPSDCPVRSHHYCLARQSVEAIDARSIFPSAQRRKALTKNRHSRASRAFGKSTPSLRAARSNGFSGNPEVQIRPTRSPEERTIPTLMTCF